MNRNVESHFAELPSVDIERSIFDRSCGHKTSFNVGELIPFFVDEVLPGDTFNVTTSIVARLQTLLSPIMDNVYLDTYYFFVPNRIVWEHWKEFMGENTLSAWYPTTQYQVPHLTYPTSSASGDLNTTWFVKGTIADYFGIPVGANHIAVDDKGYPMALPFRGFAMIYDQWFRDQNSMDPLVIPVGDSTVVGSNGCQYVTDVAKGGQPPLVAKYHDYFTSCLPSPQKAPQFSIFDLAGKPKAPVLPTSENIKTSVNANDFQAIRGFGNSALSNPDLTPYTAGRLTIGNQSGSISTNYALSFSSIDTSASGFMPNNLWADLGEMSFSINELRLAFQLQKFYEKNARGGTRYREILKMHFGVTSPDARMMIPEYLGGHRFPLQIHQVANQSQGVSDFLGDLGAMSNTSDVHEDFVKSFTEHGFVIGVMCVRYDHSYSQGLERFWSRRDKLDYYWPVFANIGEQPVYNREIYNFGNDAGDVFGYQEAWAEYRYKPNRVSSEMRPELNGSFESWHLGDEYVTTPTLSADWLYEDKSNVDRVLAVTSSNANQVFADIYVKNICTRPMPMYSIPGLIDHH